MHIFYFMLKDDKNLDKQIKLYLIYEYILLFVYRLLKLEKIL